MSYDLKCEDAPSHYGHGYGKDQSKVTMITIKLIIILLADIAVVLHCISDTRCLVLYF